MELIDTPGKVYVYIIFIQCLLGSPGPLADNVEVALLLKYCMILRKLFITSLARISVRELKASFNTKFEILFNQFFVV